MDELRRPGPGDFELLPRPAPAGTGTTDAGTTDAGVGGTGTGGAAGAARTPHRAQ
jgi:hypothetical protein